MNALGMSAGEGHESGYPSSIRRTGGSGAGLDAAAINAEPFSTLLDTNLVQRRRSQDEEREEDHAKPRTAARLDPSWARGPPPCFAVMTTRLQAHPGSARCGKRRSVASRGPRRAVPQSRRGCRNQAGGGRGYRARPTTHPPLMDCSKVWQLTRAAPSSATTGRARVSQARARTPTGAVGVAAGAQELGQSGKGS